MIHIKSKKQIEGIRAACRVVAAAHRKVQDSIKPGMSTYQVDNHVKHVLRECGAKSAFKKYRQGNRPAFPAYSCISINEEVVHGIRSHNRYVQEGDIVTVDVGAKLDGYIGDAAITLIVGDRCGDKERRLVCDTYEALHEAIAMSRPGVFVHTISGFLYDFATERGYGVVTDYYGHGVGLKLHEPPQIPNFRPAPGSLQLPNVRLQTGMTITYEPMYTLGLGETEELSDQWTVVTKDRSIAAHWEHTILITDNGAEILTI